MLLYVAAAFGLLKINCYKTFIIVCVHVYEY